MKGRHCGVFAVLLTLLVGEFSFLYAAAVDGSPDAFFYTPMGTDRPPTAILPLPDGKILVGGPFVNYAGAGAKSVARLKNDGQLDATFNAGSGMAREGSTASIIALRAQADGKALVLGLFDYFNGAARNNLVRLNTDGSVDLDFNPAILGPVNDVAIQPDGKLIICGPTSIAGVMNDWKIYRLNIDSSLDDTFLGPTLGLNGATLQVRVLSSGKILASVSYFKDATTKAHQIVRLKAADGSLDETFTRADGADAEITGLGVALNGKIVGTGNFDHYDGIARRKIVRLTADGSVDTTFNATAVDAVNSFAILGDGKILLVGSVSGASHFARLRNDGSVNAYLPTMGGPIGWNFVFATAQGNMPLLSAIKVPLSFPGPMPIPPMPVEIGVFRFNPDTTGGPLIVTPPAAQSITETGTAIFKVVPDGTGPFTYQWKKNSENIPGATSAVFRIESVTAANAAMYSVVVAGANGETLTEPVALTVLPPLPGRVFRDSLPPPGANVLVRTIARGPDGKLYIPGGGPVQVINTEQFFSAVSRFLPNGQRDSSFGPALIRLAANGPIHSIGIQSDGKIVLGGELNEPYADLWHTGILRITRDGVLDTTFGVQGVGSGADGTIFKVAIQPNNEIIVGGSAINYDDNLVGHFFRLGAAGTVDMSFIEGGGTGAAKSGDVRDIAIRSDGKIFAVGNFTTYNGVNVSGAILVNEDGAVDDTFAPLLPTVVSMNACVAQPDGKFLVGGSFDLKRSGGLVGVIRLNRDGSMDSGFDLTLPDAEIDGEVFDLALQPDGKVIAAGSFTRIGSLPLKYLARFNVDGTVDQNFSSGAGPNDVVRALCLTPEGVLWVGGDFTTIDDIPRWGLARINIGPLDFPSLTVTAAVNGMLTINWTNASFKVQFKDTLNQPNWTDLSDPAPVNIDTSAATRFFRLAPKP